MNLGYAYANARIKAMEAKLLREQSVREMLVVKSISELTALLEETPYKAAVVKASSKYSGVEVVLHGVQDDLRSTLEKLSSFIPKDARGPFAAITSEWQASDIKNIILAKANGAEALFEESKLVSMVLLKKLSKAKGLEEVFAVLRSSEYSAELAVVEEEFKKTHDFRLLIKAVDNHYYAGLSKLLGQDIDQTSKKLITEKIALTNALIVLRMKRDGLPREEIAKELISPVRERELLDAKDLDACIEILKKHGLSDESAASLSAIEITLYKQFTEKTLRILKTSVLSFGVVLGYIYLKQTEVDNLKKIALGKEFGIEEEMAKSIFAINK